MVLFLKEPPGWGSYQLRGLCQTYCQAISPSSSSYASTPSKIRLARLMANRLLSRRSVSHRAGLNGAFCYTQERLFHTKGRNGFPVGWKNWKRGGTGLEGKKGCGLRFEKQGNDNTKLRKTMLG